MRTIQETGIFKNHKNTTSLCNDSFLTKASIIFTRIPEDVENAHSGLSLLKNTLQDINLHFTDLYTIVGKHIDILDIAYLNCVTFYKWPHMYPST